MREKDKRVKNCPICGRKPKIFTYQVNYVEYSCKGTLFARHKLLRVDSKGAYAPSECFKLARKRWNDLVSKEVEEWVDMN